MSSLCDKCTATVEITRLETELDKMRVQYEAVLTDNLKLEDERSDSDNAAGYWADRARKLAGQKDGRN
tara:strand:- start:8832 stop:9035 length:204 start_codon:yes stop_codon:yes gene_type:complete